MTSDLTRSPAEVAVQGSARHRLSRGLIAAITFGSVLQALNASTMAVALVDIREQFQAGAAISWLISGLYLATAVGSPAAGRLADLYGPRRILLVCLALTLVSSVAAPWSPSLGWLIVFRTLLGVGTCAAFPAGLALLRSESDRLGITLPAAALSALTIGGQVMIALGPVLGGVLVQYWGWPGIFLVNVPLVGVATVMSLIWLPRDAATRSTASRSVLRTLDLVGSVLFTGVIAVVMLFLLSLSRQPQWWWLPILVVLIAVFVRWERRAEQPFLDVRSLARNRALSTTYARTCLTYVAFYLVFFGFPMWLQSGRGLPPGQVGLVVLPIALVAMGAVGVSAAVLRRVGYRPVLIAGSVLLLVGGAGVMLLDHSSAVLSLVLVAALFGLPNGFNNIGNQTALYQQAAAADAGVAAGLYRTSQHVAATIAAAVIELCFAGGVDDAGVGRLGAVIVLIGALLLAGMAAGSVRGWWRRTRPTSSRDTP
ncbi:MFS transporter [Parasphingorhabdus pacifica]